MSKIRRIAVLGAGYMGSAFSFPLSERGIHVNLWGTWLDDEIIDTCSQGQHPKLEKQLNRRVILFKSDQLKEAINSVDAVVMAVSSEGFVPVFTLYIEECEGPIPVLTLTKGFVILEDRVMRLSEAASRLYQKRFPARDFKWVSIGGPVKAVELANHIPSATLFASFKSWHHKLDNQFCTPYYRIFKGDDVVGTELSSALKNVYAIAIGICDGIYKMVYPEQYHNLKAFLFTQSIKEMVNIVERFGGKAQTVYGLAGMGDLYVTAASGRNRLLGERIGRGEESAFAFESMLKADLLAEGYGTLKMGRQYIKQQDVNLLSKLPLYETLYEIVHVHHRYNGQFEPMIEKLGKEE